MRIDSVSKKIILVSFVSLFLELLIIRLISTEIRIFAYFSNLVLLATFVGLGIGMILKQKFSPIISSTLLFLIIVITSGFYIVRLPNLEFRLFSGITELLAPLSEAYIWQQIVTYSKTGVAIGLFLTVLLFLIIVFTFIPFGQILGELLSKHKKPIVAYSANVIASIAGLWAFQIFSIIRFSPYLGIVFAIFSTVFFLQDKYLKLAAIILSLFALAYIMPKVEPKMITYWSPYQKLSLSPILKDFSNPNPQPAGWYMEVNNVGYMSLLDMSDIYRKEAEREVMRLNEDKLPDSFIYGDQYTLPFKFKPEAKEVLIVGAGAGNDTAGAIRGGAGHIDAVEIDPTIIEIGKKFHPEKPYRSKNVSIFIDDGRSFFQKTEKKYDLVIMSLADSHTLSSSLTNLRLDHYLYTKESFERIKNILSDDGVLFMTFEVTRPWIGSRLSRSISDVFGQEPIIFDVRSQGVYGWGGVVFATSKNPEIIQNILSNDPGLNKFVSDNRQTHDININPLTDDWPYLYLDKPRIPVIHLLLALILGGSLLFLRRRLFGENPIHVPMFLWGAAFLLFEFQNISKTSLLFGLTWVTNLFTISAILFLILLANWSVSKNLISKKTAFMLLLASLFLQLILNVDLFNRLPMWQKIITGSLVLNLPVFFGGIIFVRMFAEAKNKARAFGSNFLGSVFGGFAEIIAFAFGIHAVLYLVILLYFAGYLLWQKGLLPKFRPA